MDRGKLQKITVIVMIITAVFMVFILKNESDLTAVMAAFSHNTATAVITMMILYFIKGVVMFIPVQVLYLAAGAITGNFWQGILINITGVAICLSVPYRTGKILGQKKARQLSQKYTFLKSVSRFEQSTPFFFSFSARLIGVIPCDVLSMYCGAKAIPFRPYLTGSVAGMLPGIISTSILGANITTPGSPWFAFGVIFHIFTIILSVRLYNKFNRKHRRYK